MKKRLISILLSLSMVLTLLPATVLSAGVGTSKAGDATFTLSASSASCAGGHTGEIGNIQITDVDISQWKTDKRSRSSTMCSIAAPILRVSYTIVAIRSFPTAENIPSRIQMRSSVTRKSANPLRRQFRQTFRPASPRISLSPLR